MKNVNLPKIAEMMVGASGAEMKAVCTEGLSVFLICFAVLSSYITCISLAGMFALRERRIHVTQDDFELAAVRIMKKDSNANMSIAKLFK